MDPRERLIVALDVKDIWEADRIVRQHNARVGCFKVGYALITRYGGPAVIEHLNRSAYIMGGNDIRIMYDGKFHDIPTTMAEATKAISERVQMFTTHASSGIKGMKAVVANKREALALAVTVLSTFEDYDTRMVYGQKRIQQIRTFLGYAMYAKMDGIVCAPADLPYVKPILKNSGMKIVVTGVRPKGVSQDDQKNVLTPGDAIRAGADYIIVGRPITNPPEGITSVEMVKNILTEIAEAL